VGNTWKQVVVIEREIDGTLCLHLDAAMDDAITCRLDIHNYSISNRAHVGAYRIQDM